MRRRDVGATLKYDGSRDASTSRRAQSRGRSLCGCGTYYVHSADGFSLLNEKRLIKVTNACTVEANTECA